MIEFKNVYKKYDNGTEALKNVNLRIERGEFVFIVGASGSGKSTFLKTIMREEVPTSGSIMINNYDLTKMTNKEIPYFRRTMGIVFQDFRLIPTMTVYDNVAFAMRVIGTKEKDIRKRVPYILQLVGLSQKARSMPNELSGGEQQRVSLARALVNNPDLIIADEPISALDVSIRAQVLNLLKKFQKERGLSYLFIAHDLSIVRFISDRIAVIHKGKIVEIAETEELFKYPLHPYTKSLMSAIPIPDPILEKNKVLFVYDPSQHDYSEDKPRMEDLGNGHFIYGNERELDHYKKERFGN